MRTSAPSQAGPWPSDSAQQLARLIHEDVGAEEALALAFTPPLAFDVNESIKLRRAANPFYERCDNLVELLLLKKPRHYQFYIEDLLKAGFLFEARDHFSIGRLLLKESDDALIDACVAQGLDLHAHDKEDGHNLLHHAAMEGMLGRFEQLLARGLDPFGARCFVEASGRQVRQGVFSVAMQFCRGPDAATGRKTYIEIPLTLLKLGAAKITSGVNANFIYFADCQGNECHAFYGSDDPNRIYGDRAWERDRFTAIRDYYTQTFDEISLLMTSGQKMHAMTTEQLIGAYSICRLRDVCAESWWQGHEAQFFQLYSAMPDHIQHEIEQVAPDLVIRATNKGVNTHIQLPAQHWTIAMQPSGAKR